MGPTTGVVSVLAISPAGPRGKRGDRWGLSDVKFYSSGAVGSMILDTGAGVTCVSSAFVSKTTLSVRSVAKGDGCTVRVADGKTVSAVGYVDLPITIQLMLTTEDGSIVHWDRCFTLRDVLVLPLNGDTPRDLYVSYGDWEFGPRGDPDSPLGSLARMVADGAVVVDSPRAPVHGVQQSRVVIQRDVQPDLPVVAAVLAEEDLRKALWLRIPEGRRDTPFAAKLVAMLMERHKVFEPMDPTECTEMVDFELIGGEPEPVSFRVKIPRKAQGTAAVEGLHDWASRGICERVAWSEPSYGFVIVVPKANGKWRVTISPSQVNKSTRRIDPEGGYMPSSMVFEAMKAGRQSVAACLDLAEAFVTLKLGPTARRLSTFTTPIGKYRWLHGYYGWHSFPAAFQRIIMERVVLPALDSVPKSTILSWIDDLVVAARDNDTFLAALTAVIDNILSIGGRLSLDKCQFLVQQFDWCGVEVDLATSQWRIAASRVSSFAATPIPTDRETLTHVLGVIRYYYWGVTDQLAQRARLAKLAELDVPGIRLASKWTPAHTTAMRDAFAAIASGDWILVYDPTQPVWVGSDASGNHGFAVTACQYDTRSGKMRPVAYFSRGWQGPQLNWTPQVKEAYGQMWGVCKIMPEAFPYADVILVGDNMNLTSENASLDKRVQRWQQDIKDAGCVRQRNWVPGERNTINDYGSRIVVADPNAVLSEEDKFELHLYAILKEGEEPGGVTANATEPDNVTVVPGHLPMAATLAKIVAAQEAAGDEERATWMGPKYSTVELAGHTIVLYDGRLVVPQEATGVKSVLMRMAHDDVCHYTGAERTLVNLVRQAKVYWVGMADDVTKYVKSCYRCEFAKAPHATGQRGQLNPTVSPHVHHTWYVDLKGPMPYGTGYLMAVIEAVTRKVKLRYLPRGTAKEVCEELEEVIHGFGTSPRVMRSDSGQPFDSDEYRAFCTEWGIQPVLGVAHHSQGQGLVENRFRGIAAAIIATLGHKAPRTWLEGPLLGRLEGIVNATNVDPVGGSPTWAMSGREPRTKLSAAVDWSVDDFGNGACGLPALSYDDYCNIVAQHHAALDAVQGRVLLATSLAQAVTKRSWDAAHVRGNHKVGDWVLLHRVAPNRMLPHFTGPYRVVTVTADDNFVTARHFLGAEEKIEGPFHVSRLIPFDMSRATKEELAHFQLDVGSGIVDGVDGHRVLADGTYEFKVRWFGYPVPSWLGSKDVRQVIKVLDYCKEHGLPLPGAAVPKARGAPPGRGGRGGRGRRGRSVRFTE